MRIFILIIYLIFSQSCTPPETNPIRYVSFGQNSFNKTKFEDIKIFKNRLNIKSKYDEIGVFIINDNTITLSQIKKEASKYGANALLFEGKNVVLIRLGDIKKQKNINEEDIKI